MFLYGVSFILCKNLLRLPVAYWVNEQVQRKKIGLSWERRSHADFQLNTFGCWSSNAALKHKLTNNGILVSWIWSGILHRESLKHNWEPEEEVFGPQATSSLVTSLTLLRHLDFKSRFRRCNIIPVMVVITVVAKDECNTKTARKWLFIYKLT